MLRNLILISAVALTGCSNFSKTSLKYKNETLTPKIKPIENSNIVSSKKFWINSVTIDSLAIPKEAKFEKTNTLVLPLILFNSWNHTTKYTTGLNQFKTRYDFFIKSQFEQGISQFGYKLDSSNADFKIDIKIRKANTSLSNTKTGLILFAIVAYGFSFEEYDGPFTSDFVFDITVNQKDKNYTNDINSSAFLTSEDFRNDIDNNMNRLASTQAFALNDAIIKLVKVLPK